MARYVDANDAQKFRQYTQPHARAQIARGEFDAVRADILARVAQVEAQYALDPIEVRDRRRERRLADLRREWASNTRNERFAQQVAGA